MKSSGVWLLLWLALLASGSAMAQAPYPAARTASEELAEGVARFKAGDLDIAERELQECLRKNPPPDVSGASHKLLGNVYMVRGELDKAWLHYVQAETLFRRTANQSELTNVMSDRAALEKRRHRYAEALRLYTIVLGRDRERGDAFAEGQTHLAIGDVQTGLGRPDRALVECDHACSCFKRTGRLEYEALALVAAGNAQAQVGHFAEAEAQYQQGLAVYEQVHSDSGRSRALFEMARMRWQRGLLEEARQQALSALAAAVAATQPAPRAEVLNLLGLIHEDLGQRAAAQDFYHKALHDFGSDERGRALVLQNLGNVHLACGAVKQALAAYQQERDLYLALHDERGAAGASNSMGLVYLRQSNVAQAVASFRDAASRAGSAGDVATRARAENNLAYAWLQCGRLPEAASACAAAQRHSATQSLDAADRVSLLGLSGLVAAQQHRTDEALASFRAALDLVDYMRAGLSQQLLKATFLADKGDLYEAVIQLLVDSGRAPEVFNWIERARSRAFLDLLGERRLRARHSDPQVQALIDSELELAEQIAGAPNDAALRQGMQRHEEVMRKLQQVDAEYTEYAASRGTEPVALDTVQARLGTDSALIEYYLGRQRALACVVTGQSVTVVELPSTSAHIVDLVGEVRRLVDPGLKGDRADPSWQDKLAELYRVLWVPLAPAVGSRHRVCITPCGMLHYLPFQALVSRPDADHSHVVPQPRFLVDDYEIFYAPSASVLELAAHKNPLHYRKALVLGNAITELGPLEAAESEARAVGKLLPQADVFVRDAASEALVKQHGGEYDVLHFATHGELLADRPMDSRLLLTRGGGEDGSLTVRDIFGLRLHAYLVVLSACESGEVASLAEGGAGDDMVGLTRSFLYAGTPSVVASLWPVDDRATMLLMTKFYGELVAGDKAEALRRGELAVLERARHHGELLYGHPTLWAPFVLVGDYR